MRLSFLLVSVAAIASAAPASAREWLVHSQPEYREAAAKVAPGDTIVLANGEWKDFAAVLRASGAPGRPITLTAQTPGKVVLTGASNLKLGGSHLLVSNLVFRDGHSPDDEVVSFRTSAKNWADSSRITGLVIDRFNQPDRRKEDHWVALYGTGNRVDHSHFEGKANAGAMMVVIRQKGMPLENRAQIDHNYFGPRPPLGSNGGETIRIGTSTESGSDSHSVVEDNVFERCDGEVEIVSIKSGGNIVRRNLFLESQGSVVLRHGSGNSVEDNVFLGHGLPHTGGIRVINERQRIRNNYLEGLAGTDFTSAIAVMNGVPNSPVNRYMPVRDAVIERNTIVDVARITIGAGADAERSQAPAATRIAGNLIAGSQGADPIRIESDPSGVRFEANLLLGKASAVAGVAARDMTLDRAANGLLYPRDRALDVGVSRTLAMPLRAAVGVSWYPKPAHVAVTFGSGRTVGVKPGAALAEALRSAGDGGVIELARGSYSVAAPLVIDRTVTLRAVPGAVTLRMSAPTLFQIEEGGALQLVGVDVDGAAAPHAPGNAVIRSSGRPMLGNYRLRIERSRFTGMDGAPGFDIVASTPSTLAGEIAIADSRFENVSGSVVAGRSETGTEGWYSAERVAIDKAQFTRVGTVAALFRGGTDESTFGPHFALTGSTVTDSGAVVLSGVQEAILAGNRFVRSKGVTVTHSVGAPRTRIERNVFAGTPLPVVRELSYKGPPRASLEANVVEKSL